MFCLQHPTAKEPTFILIRLSCTDGRFKYSVRKKVAPANWSGTRVINDTGKVNLLLAKMETVITGLTLQRDLQGAAFTRAVLKSALDKAFGREIQGKNFFEAIDQIIDDREAGRELTPRGKRFSWHTIKGYRHTRDNLKRFDSRMTFEAITMKTYDDLVAFFNHKDHSLNSLGKIVKNWKVFLKAAHKRGLHSNLIFAHEDFKVPGEDTDDIYLDEKELKNLYDHHFANKGLDRARDWFIIDCFTGLRVSDIQLLAKDHILKDRIQIANEKTDTKVVIPIHPYVKAILKKWNGLPPKITDQEINRSIKECCELAGIKETILYSVTKGGQRRDFHCKKYEMVSNHSARRSFITNLLNAGIPDNQVMQLAGIKKHATLMKYKKTKPEETAKLLAGHKFFK